MGRVPAAGIPTPKRLVSTEDAFTAQFASSVTDMKPCKHQFFKIKPNEKYSAKRKKEYDEAEKQEGLLNLTFPDIFGVRVICALCNEVRDLYEPEE
jgi:ppGpp synthetase/RelA/SpoT-type nucleotidyltranferase